MNILKNSVQGPSHIRTGQKYEWLVQFLVSVGLAQSEPSKIFWPVHLCKNMFSGPSLYALHVRPYNKDLIGNWKFKPETSLVIFLWIAWIFWLDELGEIFRHIIIYNAEIWQKISQNFPKILSWCGLCTRWVMRTHL